MARESSPKRRPRNAPHTVTTASAKVLIIDLSSSSPMCVVRFVDYTHTQIHTLTPDTTSTHDDDDDASRLRCVNLFYAGGKWRHGDEADDDDDDLMRTNDDGDGDSSSLPFVALFPCVCTHAAGSGSTLLHTHKTRAIRGYFWVIPRATRTVRTASTQARTHAFARLPLCLPHFFLYISRSLFGAFVCVVCAHPKMLLLVLPHA